MKCKKTIAAEGLTALPGWIWITAVFFLLFTLHPVKAAEDPDLVDMVPIQQETVTMEPAGQKQEGAGVVYDAPGYRGPAMPLEGSNQPSNNQSGSTGAAKPLEGNSQPSATQSGGTGAAMPLEGNSQPSATQSGSTGAAMPLEGNSQPSATQSGGTGAAMPLEGNSQPSNTQSANTWAAMPLTENAGVQTVEEGSQLLSDLLDMDTVQDNTSSVSNILLIGQDAREGEEQQRSDAMILASLNKDTGDVNLISFMRDMYVEIPGYGSDRINAAFSYGGPSLLVQTIEQNFGVKIDHYMEVDLEGFIRAMSSVGELEIELNQEEADYLNANDSYGTTDNSISTGDRWNLQPGLNYLDPEQALAYARIRYVGNSDYERTERQRKVLFAAFQKLKSVDLLSLMGTAADLLSVVHTDMGIGEMISYCTQLIDSDVNIVSTARIPADGAYSSQVINGMDVLVPDLEANRALLQTWLNS